MPTPVQRKISQSHTLRRGVNGSSDLTVPTKLDSPQDSYVITALGNYNIRAYSHQCAATQRVKAETASIIGRGHRNALLKIGYTSECAVADWI